MLILSRGKGEVIRIGDDIVIKVNRIGAKRVEIAIEAPKAVRILRSELLTKKRAG